MSVSRPVLSPKVYFAAWMAAAATVGVEPAESVKGSGQLRCDREDEYGYRLMP